MTAEQTPQAQSQNPNEDLAGRAALVTGSSRGLGRHYALHLARLGADVVIHDVDARAAAEFGEAESGEAVAEEVRALGRRSVFVPADLTDPAAAERLVARSVEELGRLDIVVNNAGGDIGATGPRPDPNDALDIDPEDIRAVVERNVLTTMYTCKFAGRHMRERRTGKIVNVGRSPGTFPPATASSTPRPRPPTPTTPAAWPRSSGPSTSTSTASRPRRPTPAGSSPPGTSRTRATGRVCNRSPSPTTWPRSWCSW